LSESKTLGHGNVAVSLEQHHGVRLAGLHVTNQELGKDIKPELYVSDCLNKPNGQEPAILQLVSTIIRNTPGSEHEVLTYTKLMMKARIKAHQLISVG